MRLSVVFPTRRARCCSVEPKMVAGINLQGPPRLRARRLLPLPLLLLAVMASKVRADLGCYDGVGVGYWLSDPSKCWVTEINAAFNGKLSSCDTANANAVSRMRVRSMFLFCTSFFFWTSKFHFASPPLQFPEWNTRLLLLLGVLERMNSASDCIPARLAR